MNRTQSIALFAGIFAIAMTTYGLTGVSGTPMVMGSVPQSMDNVSMLGHVEYTVFDENNQIKTYVQSDNTVVEHGKDCVGMMVFGATQGVGDCTTSAKTFRYIGIGNGTHGTEAEGLTQLPGTGCATSASVGELARKLVVPDVITKAATTFGAEVELDVGTNTFTFAKSNTTTPMTVTTSGIFNDLGLDGQDYTEYDGSRNDGSCVSFGAEGTDWQMFAMQDLSGTGVDVTAGDSLAVKWTITIN